MIETILLLIIAIAVVFLIFQNLKKEFDQYRADQKPHPILKLSLPSKVC